MLLAEKKESYIKIAKLNDVDIKPIEKPDDLKWRTHCDADQALQSLAAEIAKMQDANNGKTTQKEKAKMTLKELQAEYDAKLIELNGAGEFKAKKFKTKAEAMDMLDDIETFIEQNNDMEENAGSSEEEKPKEEKKAGKKDATPGTKPDGSVNRVQWVILNLFGRKKSMLMGALKDAYMEDQEKDNATIVPAQVGMMVKLGLLEKEGEKDKAKITITKAGKEAAKGEEPAVGSPAKPKKPAFEPPYSDEEIADAKKKKAKKMKKANEEAFAAYKAEHGRTQTPTPDHLKSQYEGTVPEGRWQKGRKNQSKPSSSRAVMDLFEQECYDEDSGTVLMSKVDFIALCVEEHKINEGNARTNMNGMIRHHKVPKEAWENIGSKPKATKSEDKKEKKKDKKKKKGKKKK